MAEIIGEGQTMATFDEMAEYVENNGNICNACSFQIEGCDGGVRGSPSGPIYPPCADTDYKDLLNEERLIEEYESLKEEKP